MRLRSCVKTASLLLTASGLTPPALAVEVSVCTDAGNFVIELDEINAPLHSANFLEYVDRGFYSGTVFHRVIDDFMIQGGGFDRQLAQKPTLGSVANESRNGVSNLRGTVAAARTADPHSAGSQFFVNVVDNIRLDGSNRDWGYSVFGRVTSGMDIVDEIAGLPTGASGPFPSDVPDPLVAVRSMARLERDALAGFPSESLEEGLLSEIRTASESGDSDVLLSWLGHYRAACLAMNPELLYLEARTAAATGRPARAASALGEFFDEATAGNRLYAEAEQLRTSLAAAAQPESDNQLAACVAPEVPDVPDGTREDMEAMLRGQSNVRSFMRDSTAYLECLDEIIDDEERDEGLRALAVNEYNRMVDITQQLGDDFNEQVRAFRARD